ncbi:MAG: UDP-N-acetylmuramoyl-L-alanyl-D-glutamate--2,6-diaminopimelate ligase [Betaproteobacteria bacterium]|nr:UDP-N-acetylmuramoyl-L-alanyl-D-glutamate--2,6-diaminopimelate ligase [Betaproteobacteria bacterium]
MIGTELDQNFYIQPGKALLLLEVESLLAETPPEASPLRRTDTNQDLPLVWDSRRLSEHTGLVVFIARKTSRHDTHNLVEQLLSAGHVVVAEEQSLEKLAYELHGAKAAWFDEIKKHPHLILCTNSERARDLLVKDCSKLNTEQWTTIAITGTNGKTSTTQMTATLLEELSRQPVLRLGTLGIQVGSHMWDNPFPTMPDYPGLLSALRAAKNDFECRQVVMEATSIGLDENRLGDWPVHCAAYLNLSQDHLDYHGTMELYLEAKLNLFKRCLSHDGQAIINCMDAYWQSAVAAAKGKNRFCVGFGTAAEKNNFFREARPHFAGCRFLEVSHRRSTTSGISGQWTLWLDPHNHSGECQYHVQLLGEVQHENLAASAAMMISLGYPLSQISQVTGSVRSIPGRLEPVASAGVGTNLPCVLVDYAHSPDALEKTIKTCRALLPPEGKLICVFGCGGDRDPGKRPKMGQIASNLADKVWCTSDNPRTEDPERILRDIELGVLPARKAICNTQVDRAQAISEAISAAQPQDLVLVAGKGHEDYQIIGTTKYPFSDSEVARRALAAKNRN